jgi:hypothetical protein
MKRIYTVALSLVLASSLTGWCGADSLQETKPAELPVRAAELVKAAKRADQESTTVSVVKEVASINPASVPAVVGAIARRVPSMAALAAGAATAQLPAQAVAIAKAAAAAAPTKAGEIAEFVCKAAPGQYRGIVLAVAQASPKAGKQILLGLGQAMPQFAASIQQVMDNYRGVETMPAVLDQISATAQTTTETASVAGNTAAPAPRGPAVGPPYIPLSGNPGSSSPGTSGDVPPGGRDYSAP